MSFLSLLKDTIAIERPYAAVLADVPVLDDYGHPETEYVSVTEEAPGFIDSKTTREIPLTSDGGAMIGLFTAYFLPDADLTNADRLHVIATGDAYQIKGIRPKLFGSVPHFEVDCDLITSVATPLEAGS